MSILIKTRLYVADPFSARGVIPLTSAQVHYLRNVLRLSRGVEVLAFNGRDGEWRARIAELAKDHGILELEEQTRSFEPSPDVWLLFAPIKRQGVDLVAEKATELGVARLWPILTKHTAVSRINTERLYANAVEAAQQCQRLDVPEVMAPVSVLDVLKEWPRDRPLFVCAEAGEGRETLLDSLRKNCPRGTPAAILVGAEGGFARSELDALRQCSFVHLVQLGPRILRAETACLAALSCWQLVCGDW